MRILGMLAIAVWGVGQVLATEPSAADQAFTEPDPEIDLTTLVAQPIQEYFFEDVPYTHLGSDFGPIGEANQLEWRDSRIVVQSSGLAGMWHGLVGFSSESHRVLDFNACLPSLIVKRFQPKVRGVYIVCQLRGTCQIEIKDADNQVLWSTAFTAQDGAAKVRRFQVPTARLAAAKFLNWSVNNAAIAVHRFGLLIDPPPNTSVLSSSFLYSFGKLARCYDPRQGLVKDKAFSLPGQFDCVPTSGMFCLSAAVAARVGFVEPVDARTILDTVHSRIGQAPRSAGLLPHFLSGTEQLVIAPGSEFSSVDSSLYFHAMLLAASLLGADEVLEQLEAQIRAIDFPRLTSSEGYISHGLATDGSTLLASHWADWGGESALVMLLHAMQGEDSFPPLRRPGKVHHNVGFIAEIQSLFYPQFSLPRLDREGVNWLDARRDALSRQQAYFRPTTPCSQLGVYGLSAGEAAGAKGYVANGTEMDGVNLIHPHYLIMSSGIRKDPRETYETIKGLANLGMFPPWGLVENIHPELNKYLAYHGSLNASFECLAAYHLAAQLTKQEDHIYRAAKNGRLTKRAIRIFFPKEKP